MEVVIMHVDHYAIWAWVGIAVLITSYVTAFDVWASKTGHRAMTTQVRIWLHGEISGPLIAALWVAVFVGLTFHFLVKGH